MRSLKAVLVLAGVLLINLGSAFASGHELCKLAESNDEFIFRNFTYKDLLNANSTVVNVANYYLAKQGYTQETLTAEAIIELFSENGTYQSDELNYAYFHHVSGVTEYLWVRSYPGDNEYGVIVSLTTLEVVADIQDGELHLTSGSCQ